MKSRMCYSTILVLLSFLLIRCDVVYPIWDFPPTNIGLIVRNSFGENLLNPAVGHNILDNDVSVEYNGKIYQIENLNAKTRYIPSRWYGLRVGKCYLEDDDYDGTTALLFGEFSVDTKDGYHGEAFTINWNDGTSDKVKFDLYVTYRKRGKESTVHKKIWLNGELQSDDSLVVEIVK